MIRFLIMIYLINIPKSKSKCNLILETPSINLGSDDIPRIKCANNKLNLCVRSAVVKHPIVENDIYLIRQFVVKINKFPRLSDLFEDAKCRLRTENDTRWGSTYLQLEMIH